ncbi:MAG: hypothetical protein U9Q67_00015 [Patescibacteria group bacterium]|nr:hypothetical protein [Patescibacteria group bacterium]
MPTEVRSEAETHLEIPDSEGILTVYGLEELMENTRPPIPAILYIPNEDGNGYVRIDIHITGYSRSESGTDPWKLYYRVPGKDYGFYTVMPLQNSDGSSQHIPDLLYADYHHESIVIPIDHTQPGSWPFVTISNLAESKD